MPVRPSRVRRLNARKTVARIAVVGAALTVVASYFAIQKSVTLIVEGQPEPVRTMSSSVGELLDANGIEVGARAVHIPQELTWVHEVAEHDGSVPTLRSITQLPVWLATNG